GQEARLIRPRFTPVNRSDFLPGPVVCPGESRGGQMEVSVSRGSRHRRGDSARVQPGARRTGLRSRGRPNSGSLRSRRRRGGGPAVTGDRIVLTIPRNEGYENVAQLVIAGVAARLDFSYEFLDDLRTALETLLD